MRRSGYPATPPRTIASLLFVAVFFCLTSAPALSQQNQCRTAPVGTSTSYCASEAFVTNSRGREVLTSARTYFVRTDGNDACNGLVNAAGSSGACAFLTLQKAMDTVAALDCSIFDVNVNVANGAYGSLILKTYIGSGTVTFLGNSGTPSSVTITSAGGTAVLTSAFGGKFTLNGFRIQGNGAQDVQAGSPTTVTITNVDLNGSGNNFRGYATFAGTLVVSSGVSIYTGGIGAFLAEQFGTIYLPATTVAIAANVTYSSAFATSRFLGNFTVPGATFSLGAFTVTGPRYFAGINGIFTGTGANPNFFPGTVAGSTSTGGQYQ